MKKVLLASIFGLFLFAGTGLILVANEPVAKETTAKACCETAAKTAEKAAGAGCADAKPVQTTSTQAAAKDCGSTSVQTASVSGAADCGSSAVKTANTSAASDCGSATVQTASTSAATGCGDSAVKTATASQSGCGSTSVQTTQAAEAVPGDCVKRPAGVSPQRAENR